MGGLYATVWSPLCVDRREYGRRGSWSQVPPLDDVFADLMLLEDML